MARYVEILFRFRLRFAVLLLLLPAVVGAITILLSPSYKAVAQLWVDDPSYFGGAQPSGWSQYATPAQNETDSLTQLINTRQFSHDLYAHLADAIPDPAERTNAVTNAKVQIIPTGSHLVMMTASCDQKPVCIVVVNRAVDVLREEQVADEKENAKAGQAYVTQQLQQAKTSMTTSEDALRRYILTHPGAKVDAEPATITDPELSRLALDVQQQRSRVSDLQNQVDRNNSIASQSTAVIQTLPRMVDPPILTHGFPLGDGSGIRKGMMYGGATLGIGAAYLFLLGWVDKTLRNPRDIENRFKVAVVTTIPELQPSERF